eukprot:gene3973-6429_t
MDCPNQCVTVSGQRWLADMFRTDFLPQCAFFHIHHLPPLREFTALLVKARTARRARMAVRDGVEELPDAEIAAAKEVPTAPAPGPTAPASLVGTLAGVDTGVGSS